MKPSSDEALREWAHECRGYEETPKAGACPSCGETDMGCPCDSCGHDPDAGRDCCDCDACQQWQAEMVEDRDIRLAAIMPVPADDDTIEAPGELPW